MAAIHDAREYLALAGAVLALVAASAVSCDDDDTGDGSGGTGGTVCDGTTTCLCCTSHYEPSCQQGTWQCTMTCTCASTGGGGMAGGGGSDGGGGL